MIKRTKKEILAKVKSLWDKDSTEVSVIVSEEGVHILLSSMYDPPGLNIQNILVLTKFFGTTNINDEDHFSNQGCETCDYGSEYGFTLVVRAET